LKSVDLLYFEGCPYADAARELVERAAAEEGLEVELLLTAVESEDDAVALLFLGSPTIRVEGVDVEPGADERNAFVLACRVYKTTDGVQGTPPYEWVRAALRGP
jgi:hypothetical protein